MQASRARINGIILGFGKRLDFKRVASRIRTLTNGAAKIRRRPQGNLKERAQNCASEAEDDGAGDKRRETKHRTAKNGPDHRSRAAEQRDFGRNFAFA
jgi:hypothetical protein